MGKIKLFFLFSYFFIEVINSSFGQTEYKLTFYNCAEDNFGMINNGINYASLNIYDTESNQKIEFRKNRIPGEYYFSTNKSNVKIEIENIFEQIIDTILLLNKNKTDYEICEDRFIDYDLKTSVESSFETRKRWTLLYSSKGCFHSENESIVLTFKKEEIYATHKINENKNQSITINQEKKKSLILFEKKLNLMNRPNAGCTTSVIYNITSGTENYKIVDSSCLWDGFDYLKEELGFE